MIAPDEIKKDIYKVMTSSRELANYCQESVISSQNKKISDSLNNFHSKTSMEFILKTLIKDDRLYFESKKIEFDTFLELQDKPTYIKIIDYIQIYLREYKTKN